MKRFLLLAASTALFALQAHAQLPEGLMVGIGGNYSAGAFAGLNTVVEEYNFTRSQPGGLRSIQKQMEELRVTRGINLFAGKYEPDWLYYGLSFYHNTGSTFGIAYDSAGVKERTDLRLSYTNLSAEVGYMFDYDWACLIPGVSLDVASFGTSLKNNKYSSYTKVINQFNFSLSVFVEANIFIQENFAIGFRMYSPTPLNEIDFQKLNDEVNPSGFSDELSSRIGQVGLSLSVRYFAGR